MIIDTHLHPTNLVDEAWRHTGEPFTGERMLKLMDGPYMINGKPRRSFARSTRTASSATSTTTRAGDLKTARRSWNSTSRNTASRC